MDKCLLADSGNQSWTHPRSLWGTGPLPSSRDLENTQYKASLYIGSSSFPISLPTPGPLFHFCFLGHLPIKPPASNSFVRLCFGESPDEDGPCAGDPEWEALWCRHCATENAHISESLLRAKPLT